MKYILDEFKCETLNGGNVKKILNLITAYYDKKFAEYPTLYKWYNNSQFQDDLFEFWKKNNKPKWLRSLDYALFAIIIA